MYPEENQNENYLKHHGAKGQKWGVKHGPPYPLDAKSQKALRAEWKRNIDENEVERRKKDVLATADVQAMNSNIWRFNNDEIQAIITRVEKENSLKRLLPSEPKVKTGIEKLEEWTDKANRVAEAGKKAANAYNVAASISNSFLGTELPKVKIGGDDSKKDNKDSNKNNNNNNNNNNNGKPSNKLSDKYQKLRNEDQKLKNEQTKLNIERQRDEMKKQEKAQKQAEREKQEAKEKAERDEQEAKDKKEKQEKKDRAAAKKAQKEFEKRTKNQNDSTEEDNNYWSENSTLEIIDSDSYDYGYEYMKRYWD